jgi:group I intron endonuclease
MAVGVYRITNKNTNCFYVGSAINISVRWKKHLAELKAGVHHNPQLQRSFNKHGPEAFKFEVLEECAKGDLLGREQWWIDSLSAVKLGYNIRPRAESALGLKHSRPGSKERHRLAKLGTKHTAEAREAMSVAKRGKPWTEKQRLAYANRPKGRLSEEERQRRYASRRGVPKSPEHRAKIAESNRRTRALQKENAQ